MNKDFKKQIVEHKEQLYYNSSGNVEAFRLGVRHLSAAIRDGNAFMVGGFVYPKQRLYIVDFKREIIEVVEDKIKLIELKVL